MRIKYQFATETIEIKVSNDWGNLLFEFDHQEHNMDHNQIHRQSQTHPLIAWVLTNVFLPIIIGIIVNMVWSTIGRTLSPANAYEEPNFSSQVVYHIIYTRHYKKPMLTSTLPEDLPMFQAVQRHIRQKVQNMGIFVETNPTSNLSIGDISSLRDYPITRLNTPPLPEPNPMSILLSINSDDPLVFNTNAENELALVYHTLTYRGHGREQVLNWIDKVRQYGMDSSFIRGEKERDRMLRELGALVRNLERVMGLYPPN